MVFATVSRGVSVEVTATRSEDEPGRIIRLHWVLGFVHALASNYGNTELLDKVASVDDHKGDLTVCWREIPAQGEMDLFNKAWNDDVIGDAWGPVAHVNVDGGTIGSCEGKGMSYSGSGMLALNMRR